MSVTGLLLWLVGLGMIVGGLAIAGETTLGIAVAAAGLLVLVYAGRRDYDSSRLPTEMGR